MKYPIFQRVTAILQIANAAEQQPGKCRHYPESVVIETRVLSLFVDISTRKVSAYVDKKHPDFVVICGWRPESVVITPGFCRH